MLTAAKYIGAGLACSGLIGAGVGIGVNFSSLISLKILSLFSFSVFLFLDYLIKNNYLGQYVNVYYLRFINLNYLTIVIILNCIFFAIFMLLSYFDINLFILDKSFFDMDFYNLMSDSNNNAGIDKSINANGTVNVNNPNINISIPASSLNNFAAAASVSGGGALALKVAQQSPGGPGVKAVAGAATWVAIQAATAGMAQILNANNSSGSNSSKKLIESLYVLSNDTTESLNNNLNNTSVISESINEFPLSLIPEINQLATAELMFLLIILNIFIVKYITTLDFNKYIPNNKVGNIFKKIINRYILLWSKSVNFMLIVSWSGLFFCVIFSKIFLYYVLNS